MRKLFTALCLLTLTAGIAGCAPATTMPQFVTEQAPRTGDPRNYSTSCQADPTSETAPTAHGKLQGHINLLQSRQIGLEGNPDAPITIIGIQRFPMPVLRTILRTCLKQLLQQYPDDIKVVFRHYPFPSIHMLQITAQAAEAAGTQGKVLGISGPILFQNQDSWSNLDEAGSADHFLTDIS